MTDYKTRRWGFETTIVAAVAVLMLVGIAVFVVLLRPPPVVRTPLSTALISVAKDCDVVLPIQAVLLYEDDDRVGLSKCYLCIVEMPRGSRIGRLHSQIDWRRTDSATAEAIIAMSHIRRSEIRGLAWNHSRWKVGRVDVSVVEVQGETHTYAQILMVPE